MTPPGEASDEELASKAAAGEERAFDLLMRRHKAGVYRFARRYVGDADTAYEVAQETFVSAWSALKRYDPARPFAVWLRAIALNKCRDRARRNAVRRLLFGGRGLDSVEAQSSADPSPESDELLVQREQVRLLAQAVADLPPALKEPFLLTQVEQMSQRQAAELLGVTVKTVETRVYRARRRITSVLASREEPRSPR